MDINSTALSAENLIVSNANQRPIKIFPARSTRNGPKITNRLMKSSLILCLPKNTSNVLDAKDLLKRFRGAIISLVVC